VIYFVLNPMDEDWAIWRCISDGV